MLGFCCTKTAKDLARIFSVRSGRLDIHPVRSVVRQIKPGNVWTKYTDLNCGVLVPFRNRGNAWWSYVIRTSNQNSTTTDRHKVRVFLFVTTRTPLLLFLWKNDFSIAMHSGKDNTTRVPWDPPGPGRLNKIRLKAPFMFWYLGVSWKMDLQNVIGIILVDYFSQSFSRYLSRNVCSILSVSI
jgi:hypothetical protein